MKDQLTAIRTKAAAALGGAQTLAELEELRIQYLGKKGELTAVMKGMGKLSPEERPVAGQLANEARGEIEAALETKKAELEKQAADAKIKSEAIDVTMPGRRRTRG